MNITLNGQAMPLANIQTISELVHHLGYEGKRMAVEQNGEIVPKSQYKQTPLAEGDEIEVVVAVGGG